MNDLRQMEVKKQIVEVLQESGIIVDYDKNGVHGIGKI